jgi:hypothetical protein
MAVSCYWVSDGVNSRYALESSRSLSMNFNNLKDRKRPIADAHICISDPYDLVKLTGFDQI